MILFVSFSPFFLFLFSSLLFLLRRILLDLLILDTNDLSVAFRLRLSITPSYLGVLFESARN